MASENQITIKQINETKIQQQDNMKLFNKKAITSQITLPTFTSLQTKPRFVAQTQNQHKSHSAQIHTL